LVTWIGAWLQGRKQRVVINGCASSWVTVNSGVPQGSVLGPLLFLIYINDIDCGVNSIISKFADDTKWGGKVLSVVDRVTVQNDLDKIVSWANKWQMEFNFDKCKVLHAGCHNPKHEYTMSGTVLRSTEEEKDLGVFVTSDLKFKKQCQEACKKANRALGFVARHFDFKSKEILLPLYKSIVRPHLEYAVQFWSPYTREDIERMKRVHQRATKLIPSLSYKSYEDKLKELQLHSLETRRLRGELIEVFKIQNEFNNVDSSNYFTQDYRNHTRNNGYKLHGRRFKTQRSQKLFYVQNC